jgi:hypothetical protein
MKLKEELTNPETAKLYKHNGNWNRKINIPGVWSGFVQDIPPHAVQKLIEQGRTDFVPITAAKPTSGAAGDKAVSGAAGNKE